MHVLIVGQDGLRIRRHGSCCTTGRSGQQHRHVLLIGGSCEVHVHLEGALQQGFRSARSRGRGRWACRWRTRRSNDRRPSPRTRTCCRCRCRTRPRPCRWWKEAAKCLATCALSPAWPREPVAGGQGVGHGLLGGEGLGGHQEQGGFRINLLSVSAMWVPSTLETKCISRWFL